jgi:hypothetical protein
MKASARRGLRLHEEGFSGDGLKPQTVEDARKMAEGVALSEDKWRRIAPWIARHIVDLDAVQGDEITAGLVAMLLWGGGSSKASARRAQAYAERLVARLDEEKRYDENQPRDPDGKFGSGGGGSDDDEEFEEDFNTMMLPDDGDDTPDEWLDVEAGTGDSARIDESKVIDRQADYVADLSEDQLQAIDLYTGSEFELINDYMRESRFTDPDDELEETINRLEATIADAPSLSNAQLVYRGASLQTFGVNSIGELELKLGESFQDDAFISTSFREQVADDFADRPDEIVIEMRLPAGTSGLAVSTMSYNYQESELILLPGQMRLVGIRDERHVVVEYGE